MSTDRRHKAKKTISEIKTVKLIPHSHQTLSFLKSGVSKSRLIGVILLRADLHHF